MLVVSASNHLLNIRDQIVSMNSQKLDMGRKLLIRNDVEIPVGLSVGAKKGLTGENLKQIITLERFPEAVTC